LFGILSQPGLEPGNAVFVERQGEAPHQTDLHGRDVDVYGVEQKVAPIAEAGAVGDGAEEGVVRELKLQLGDTWMQVGQGDGFSPLEIAVIDQIGVGAVVEIDAEILGQLGLALVLPLFVIGARIAAAWEPGFGQGAKPLGPMVFPQLVDRVSGGFDLRRGDSFFPGQVCRVYKAEATGICFTDTRSIFVGPLAPES